MNIYGNLPYKNSLKIEIMLVKCHGGFKYAMTFDVYTRFKQICEISIAAVPRKKNFRDYCEVKNPFVNKQTAAVSLEFFQECLEFLEKEFSGWLGHCYPTDPRRLRIYTAFLNRRHKNNVKVDEYGKLTWTL